jgi:ubiquinone/menaquinone biosynthesis C-methylase UbiE
MFNHKANWPPGERRFKMLTNVEWKAWGKKDPLWGVANWAGRERDGSNPWTDKEFYELGADWLDFERAWLQTVGYEPGTVLEIGCGAGRITRMLAGSFAKVVATDVSADMIAYARSRIRNENIDWQISDGDGLPTADNSLDAVFSCHVFQHFPSNAAQLKIFNDMQRALKPGGTFLIHLPIHAFPSVNRHFSRLARRGYAAFARLATLKAFIKRQMMKFGSKPYMHGISYEMEKLFADLRSIGFDDIVVSVITVRTNGSQHSCVSGRKP